ncbi:MAG: ABC transporter ATP-binding protein [Lentimicrobiaceae bacterium]|nr:ABC transporter ATP-binding protein [Lentimicrobiaceae bacterium]
MLLETSLHLFFENQTMSTPQPLLKIRNLKIAFKHENNWQTVVRGVDFDAFRNQTLSIVGESGSGKSVSLLAIMKLLNHHTTRIEADEILFDNIDLLHKDQKQMQTIRGKRISMIFQEPMTSLNPVFKCGFQVAEAIKTHEKLPKTILKKRVISLFEQVKLPRPETIYHSYPHELSGGQKQRVMIAMALACNPDLLIADEPTTALDVTVQKEILKLLKNLQRQTGMAMIFITHDLGVVAEIANTVAVMNKGILVEKGKVDEILNHPKHPYTQGLLNCRPPLNVRLKRLPTIRDFMENHWAEKDYLHNLMINPNDRKTHLDNLYQQQPLLSVKELKTWFPTQKNFLGKPTNFVKAVNKVSFDVYPGETLGLVGESGSGKTTLGRSILRLIEPSGGHIYFEGSEITAFSNNEMRRFRKHIQLIFQDPYSSLNPRITIGDAIAEPLLVHKLETNKQKRKQKVCELLEQVGLETSHYNRYPHEFSGGQRQRICIARALAVNPKLIVCDESVSALDVSVQAQVLNLLNSLKQKFGFTFIFISHDLSVVRYMSDRILVMYDGKIIELAEADTLFNNPKMPYTRKLIEALPGKHTPFHS